MVTGRDSVSGPCEIVNILAANEFAPFFAASMNQLEELNNQVFETSLSVMRACIHPF
jgi:hypothetical protein